MIRTSPHLDCQLSRRTPNQSVTVYGPFVYVVYARW